MNREILFASLLDGQKEVCFYNNGKVVVKACPGSGKTYSVSARIARLLVTENFRKKGIAALSFTNVACDEIKSKLKSDFKINSLGYPHFIGTLDSFINQHIFLPFGSLSMGCENRPQLVGSPISSWTVQRYENDYYQYFDKTSFDTSDMLVKMAPYQAFNFVWKYYRQDGKINGHIKNIIDAKNTFFKKGFATQADANYHAYKLLKKYPLIASSVANRFKYFIIDEAQDTNEVLMGIIDLLVEHGAENFMLIGDPDQAIFEWNNAKPELFEKKYNNWDKIEIIKNRRSSQKICDFTNALSSFSKTEAVDNDVMNYHYSPEIVGYKKKYRKRKTSPWIVTPQESRESFEKILGNFLNKCSEHEIEINKENVAVLYRGKSKVFFLGLEPPAYEFSDQPWLPKYQHVRQIIQGKYLLEQGNFIRGYKYLERGILNSYIRSKKGDETYNITDDVIEGMIERYGFKEYRKKIYGYINLLPNTKNETIASWVLRVEKIMNEHNKRTRFKIKSGTGNIQICEYFGSKKSEIDFPFYHGTIHSVKGQTFQAVLLLLDDRQGKKYSNIMFKTPSELQPKDLEELRVVYVGMTRPKKILMMAVPMDDVRHWKLKCSSGENELEAN